MAAESFQNVTAESERKKCQTEPKEAQGTTVKKNTIPDRDHFHSSCSAPSTSDCGSHGKVVPSIAAPARTFPDADMNSCNSPSSGPSTPDSGAIPSIGPPIWQVGEDCGG